MPSARHILIVNSRSVHQPVFVIGTPHSGADLLGRALKASKGFHLTIGQPSVLRVVYAFARRPSMYQGRTQAAATVIRDAFAQGWQVNAHSCLDCTRECRSAAGLAEGAAGPCAELRGLETYGDASPDLIYCAEALTYAFPDARIVQVVRDGRDVVASMLADPVVMSWYRPSFVNVDTEFPNPFFGVETEEDRELWPRLSPAGRCMLRWRWSVRLAAQLHHSRPAGQLKTIRYEHLMGKPDEALADLSRFAGTSVQAAEIRDQARAVRGRGRSRRSPAYEGSLSPEDIAEVEKIGGEELRRLGYALP
ncbi:MAG: sulfotransferase [Actinomycetota bacterium]|nr:sulfotransferase [Actinomycetota bacterium]